MAAGPPEQTAASGHVISSPGLVRGSFCSGWDHNIAALWTLGVPPPSPSVHCCRIKDNKISANHANTDGQSNCQNKRSSRRESFSLRRVGSFRKRSHIISALSVTFIFNFLQVKNNPIDCDLPDILRTEKEHCLETLSNNKMDSEMQEFEAGCEGMWDNVICWPPSSLGKTVAVPCPKVIFLLTREEGFLYRNCTSEGWSGTFPGYKAACGYDVNDTTGDIKSANYMNVKIMYTVGYSTSFISLSIAVAILGLLRKLHCTRNYIHMHLFVSHMLRAVSVFIKDSVLFSSAAIDHCNAYSVECKFVIVFFQYCIMANFSWLLVEALYLHTLLVVSAYPQKYFRWFIILGWGAPALFILPWAIARIFYENIGCWDINSNEFIWWIIKGPVLSSIFISFVLFVHIISILIKKLKAPDVVRNEFNQYKRLAKSTFLLIPLFGIHYIVFAFFPEKESNLAIDSRIGFELFFGSFQGSAVAVLYCFLNGEVRTEIKRKWRRWKQKKYFAVDLQNQHSSIINSGMTGGTQVSLLTSSSSKEQEFAFQESNVL
ncbi:secretin receptor [Pristis pectinata]|uniref:secretin receptor n=1 Tax=Pristis pectinata TaxID=685728 RepID=UPI00223D0437|nr:secretin receptor [Pristis pectinata]